MAGGDVNGIAAVEVPAGGRKSIGAQLMGHPAAGGQGVLQPLGESNKAFAAVDHLAVGPTAPGQSVVEQQMVKRFTAEGDRHPFQPGEIAEGELTGLIGLREHHLRRRAMQRLLVLHPPLEGAFH